jgi:hypothetical protein
VVFGTPVNESNRGGFFLTIALPLFNFFLPDNEKYIDHEEKKKSLIETIILLNFSITRVQLQRRTKRFMLARY